MAHIKFIHFMAVFIHAYNVLGSALQIQTVPEAFNPMTTDDLTITCRADGPAYWAKAVVSLQLMKSDQPPIAVYTQNDLIQGPSRKTNMRVEGHIERDASKSYIRVDIKNPVVKDTGSYTCLMHYLDGQFKMKEEKAVVNVTVDDQEMKYLVKHLLTKVSDLENTMEQRENETLEQLRDLNSKLFGQEKLIRQLSQKSNVTTAFFAGNTDSSRLKVGQILKFQSVIENKGDNYDKNTGIYTAPVDGLYAFHLFVNSYNGSGRKQTEIQILANDVIKATLINEFQDSYDQSSVSCVIQLKAGDEVKCQVRFVTGNDPRLNVFPYTGFTGHLITAL